MRTESATLLTVALLLAMAVDEILLFGVAPRLLAARPAPTSEDVKVIVRNAEAAEREACRSIRSADLFGPETSCEAR